MKRFQNSSLNLQIQMLQMKRVQRKNSWMIFKVVEKSGHQEESQKVAWDKATKISQTGYLA
jgi:hypothetical protein